MVVYTEPPGKLHQNVSKPKSLFRRKSLRSTASKAYSHCKLGGVIAEVCYGGSILTETFSVHVISHDGDAAWQCLTEVLGFELQQSPESILRTLRFVQVTG